jgi:hypothetical protein
VFLVFALGIIGTGLLAVPVMVMMTLMLLYSGSAVVGRFVLPGPLMAVGWIATAVMGAAAVGMFATWGS